MDICDNTWTDDLTYTDAFRTEPIVVSSTTRSAIWWMASKQQQSETAVDEF